MREIKFRAWAEGGMCDNLDSVNLEMLRKSVITFDGENFVPASYMQYTGLKDKNGKEIYTGDLVRQGSTLYEIRDCEGGWECQILQELKNGGTIEGSCYVFACLLPKACEVIGNIYENQDLL